MPQLGGKPGVRCSRSEGGVGAAVYSVKASPLVLGVTGETGVEKPFVGVSDILTLGLDQSQ
jgi:hypothetical protein